MIDKNNSNTKELFYLEKNLIYLNHGSFGATPKSILQRFIQLTELIDKNPMKFYLDEYPVMIENSRKSIAGFLNCKPDNIAFVDNATTGVNSVLFSLIKILDENSEILTTDHYYPAVKNTLNHIAGLTGCKIKSVNLPDYVESSEQLKEIIISNITGKTKLLVLDHITSISAFVFPVKEIINHCRKNNILTLIDGAHAPGLIDLNLQELNPDWFTGNLHKWLFAPKAVAILYASNPEQYQIHPTVISNDYGKGLSKEFDWVGTKNFSSRLTVPECIEFHSNYFDYDYCRQLSLFGRNLLIDKLNLKPMAHENLTGLMQSFYLPSKAGSSIEEVFSLRKELLSKHNTEVFMNPFKDRLVLRISSQIYNNEEEYIHLINALKEVL